MSDCLVLVGVSGSGKEQFSKKFLATDPSYKLCSLKEVKAQLFGNTRKSDPKLEWNTMFDKIYSYLAQGQNVLVLDGPPRIRDRKSLISYVSKIEDASVSCVEFVTDLDTCKKRTPLTNQEFLTEVHNYQSPTVDEGWQGIMRYDGK